MCRFHCSGGQLASKQGLEKSEKVETIGEFFLKSWKLLGGKSEEVESIGGKVFKKLETIEEKVEKVASTAVDS